MDVTNSCCHKGCVYDVQTTYSRHKSISWRRQYVEVVSWNEAVVFNEDDGEEKLSIKFTLETELEISLDMKLEGT